MNWELLETGLGLTCAHRPQCTLFDDHRINTAVCRSETESARWLPSTTKRSKTNPNMNKCNQQQWPPFPNLGLASCATRLFQDVLLQFESVANQVLPLGESKGFLDSGLLRWPLENGCYGDSCQMGMLCVNRNLTLPQKLGCSKPPPPKQVDHLGRFNGIAERRARFGHTKTQQYLVNVRGPRKSNLMAYSQIID